MVNTKFKNPLISTLSDSLIKMPSPLNLSLWWNFGSLLSLCLILQMITGALLAMHYSGSTSMAFSSIIHICQDVNYGWILRNMHANGASFYFMCLYLHLLRGLYYKSYTLTYTWFLGVTLLLLSMATAFLGYVLPWGQMSLWGATVITNLLSSLPYIGSYVVLWLWGGSAIDNPTLTRFFVFHFLLPFILILLVTIHLLYLHSTGSNNPLGCTSKSQKISLHPYFLVKDSLSMVFLLWLLLMTTIFYPNLFGDPENFNPANPLMSPIHIKPEWYYLFAYAILRSVPSKLGGVVALMFSVLIFYTLPLTSVKSHLFSPPSVSSDFLFWTFVLNWMLLTWIGSKSVEPPYELLSKMFASMYFSYFLILPFFSQTKVKITLTCSKN